MTVGAPSILSAAVYCQQFVRTSDTIAVTFATVGMKARCPLKLERRIIEVVLVCAAVLLGLGTYLKPVASSTDAQHSNGIACTPQKSTPTKEAGSQKECNKAPVHS